MFPTLDIPLHVEHMNERLGQLVMLHLGEAVIGIAATPLQSTHQQFVGVALATTLVWALHLTYYCGGRPTEARLQAEQVQGDAVLLHPLGAAAGAAVHWERAAAAAGCVGGYMWGLVEAVLAVPASPTLCHA